MRSIILGLALALGGMATPSLAIEEEEVSTLQPSGPWNVEYDDWLCRINRAYLSGAQKVQFSFTREPLVSKNWLYLFFENESGKRDDDDASLFIDGEFVRDDLHYNIFDAPGYRIRQIWIDLDKIPFDQTRSELRFDLARHGSIEIPVPEFQQAWQALENCMDDLYEEYGVDMEKQRAIATAPKGEIFSAIDTPGGPADFAFFYWVNEEGRIDECKLLMPSGNEEFDEGLCDQLKSNARFEPAMDAEGKPLRVAQFKNIRLRVSYTTTTQPIP